MWSLKSLPWLPRLNGSLQLPTTSHQARAASLTSAINRGIRKATKGVDNAEDRRSLNTFRERDSKSGGGRNVSNGRTEGRPTNPAGDRWAKNTEDRRSQKSFGGDKWGGGVDRKVSANRTGDRSTYPTGDDWRRNAGQGGGLSERRSGERRPWTERGDSKSQWNTAGASREQMRSRVDSTYQGRDANRNVANFGDKRKDGFPKASGSPYQGSSRESRFEAPRGTQYAQDYSSNEKPFRRESATNEERNTRSRYSTERVPDRAPRLPRSEKEENVEVDDDAQPNSRSERPRRFQSKTEEGISVPGRRGLAPVPLSVPYTTAGSEFVYGQFAVQAAIKSGRRKLHKLYIYKGPDSKDEDKSDEVVRKLAVAAGVKVMEVGGDWNKLLSKMSGSRPHNGYVLEASPIPKLPITALGSFEHPSTEFKVTMDHQSEEEFASNAAFELSSDSASIPYLSGGDRYPFVLLVDRILDPGNLGAIIRSAHFLGVDALAVVDYGNSPFSAVAVKASAGAAEYFPILMVKKEHQFIKASKGNGWKFFAAVSAGSESASRRGAKHSPIMVESILRQSPCVLMLGNEGEGLRPQLLKLADGVTSIKQIGPTDQGVDSLNVSVAAALLIQDFLNPIAKAEEVLGDAAAVEPADPDSAEKVF